MPHLIFQTRLLICFSQLDVSKYSWENMKKEYEGVFKQAAIQGTDSL